MLDQRALHRMEFATIRKIFNRDDLAAVGLTRQHDTGVDRLIDPFFAYDAAQHHRTGPAISLGAALFGTCHPLNETQVVEHGQGRLSVLEMDRPPAAQKLDRMTHYGIPKELTALLSSTRITRVETIKAVQVAQNHTMLTLG